MSLGQVVAELTPYLSAGLGFVLLGLALYAGTLTYVLRSYSRAQLSKKLPEGGARRWLEWLDEHEEALQVSTGFIRVTVNLLILVWVASWFIDAADPRIEPGTIAAALVFTIVLLLLFGIGVPHALAAHAGEAMLARSLPVLLVLRWALWPVAVGLRGVEFVVRRLLGKVEETEAEESERMEQEILEAVSEGEAHGAVDEEQKEIIKSVFDLPDTPVSAIMTPRTDIVAIRADATYDQAREAILDAGHSRIPVCEDTIDRIVGLLYAKDLIRLKPGEPLDVRRMMRPARYVPGTKTIDELLREFRQNKVHIAIVLDEYGGTAGLVTIEDIIEELVGEIDDEYDESAPSLISRIDADTLEVDGRVHIGEINEELGVALPEDEDYETVGGFVFSTLGKIPTAGEEFTHDNLHFRVVAAEARKINRLRIRVLRQPAETT